jgi:hypothetical protein
VDRWRFWAATPAKVRSVIVNLKHSDVALRGVMWSNRGAWIVLQDADLLDAHKEPRKIGAVVVERANVAFYEVLGG